MKIGNGHQVGLLLKLFSPRICTSNFAALYVFFFFPSEGDSVKRVILCSLSPLQKSLLSRHRLLLHSICCLTARNSRLQHLASGKYRCFGEIFSSGVEKGFS